MTHFYDELRRTREAENLSLKDVSTATKISQVMLGALEQGRIQHLPAAYVRAFIREYARFLELNEEQVLQAYETEFHAKNHRPPAPPPPEEMIIHEKKSFSEEPSPLLEPASRTVKPMRPPRTKRTDTNMTAVIAAVIVVVTALIFVYFFFSSESSDKKTEPANTAQAPPPIVPQYTPPAQVEQKTADTTPAAIYPKDSLTLEAATTDSVWLSIVADTAHVQRGVLPKGVKKMWRTKDKFLLTAGNSKLVSFMLNGKPLMPGDSTSHIIRNAVVTATTTTLTSGDAPPAPPPAKQGTKPAQQQAAKANSPVRKKPHYKIPEIQKVPVR